MKKKQFTLLQIAENSIKIFELETKNDPKLKVEITLLKLENHRIISKFLKSQNPD